jgi:hypothetical protein
MRLPQRVEEHRRRAAARRVDAIAMTVPRPADRHEPVTVGAEGPAVRLLLFGSGPASGWGVRDSAEGLTGSIARATAERLGRRVTVTPVIDDYWQESDPVRALQEARLVEYDAVLAVSAYRWSLVDLPLSAWRRYVDGLRDLLLAESGPDGVIQILALPWADAARRMPERWGGPLGGKIEELAGAAADSVADSPAIDLLELSAPDDTAEWGGPAFSAATYRRWGTEVAARLVPRLVAGAPASAR